MDPKQLLELALAHIRGMWRFRWVAVGISWAVCLLVWTSVYLLPDRYESSAQVYVDTRNVLQPLLKGLYVETDVMDDVTMLARAMISRPHLERVIRETDLDVQAQGSVAYESLLLSLEKRITISSTRENIFSIAFSSSDQDQALRVVTALLNTFVEDTLGSGREDSQSAEDTLRAQIDEYEQRLTAAEDRLVKFKQDNVGLLPGESGDYYENLQQILEQQKEIDQRIRVAQRERASILMQLEGEEPVFQIGTVGDPVTAPAADVADLERQRDELLVQYTEKHPAVARIDQLIERRRQKSANVADAPPTLPFGSHGNSLELNPVYQSLRIQFSDVEVRLASLEGSRVDLVDEVERLRGLVEVIPRVEAEVKRLNRDYDVVKERYETMLSRWEDLQTGKLVSSSADTVQFRVIEPPFVSAEPVGPPRSIYVIAGLVVSLGAGLAMTLVLDLINPVVLSMRDLASFGLRTLGSVQATNSNSAFAGGYGEKLMVAVAMGALVIFAGAAVVFADTVSSLLREVV